MLAPFFSRSKLFAAFVFVGSILISCGSVRAAEPGADAPQQDAKKKDMPERRFDSKIALNVYAIDETTHWQSVRLFNLLAVSPLTRFMQLGIGRNLGKTPTPDGKGLAVPKEMRLLLQPDGGVFRKFQMTNDEVATLVDAAKRADVIGLDLRLIGLTDDQFAQFESIEHMQGLSLNLARLTEAGIAHLKSFKGLKALSLNTDFRTPGKLKLGDSAAHLVVLSNLETLELCRVELTDKGLPHLGKLTRLRHLVLRGLKPRVELFRQVGKLTELRSFKFWEWKSGLDDPRGLNRQPLDRSKCIAQLAGLKKLESLHLIRVTDAEVEQIAKLVSLRDLVLPASPITNVGTKKLIALQQLKTLNLTGCWKIENQAIADLAQLPELETLVLDDVPRILVMPSMMLNDFSRSGPRVGDAGMAHLAGASKLKFLSIVGCPVSGAGMLHLQDHPRLESLDIRRTNVGPYSLKLLAKMKALKKVKITSYECQFKAELLKEFRNKRPDVKLQIEPNTYPF